MPLFNNISAIFWRSVLLVAETGVPRENHLIGLHLTPNLVVFQLYRGVT